MFTNSEIQVQISQIDNWLKTSGWPTNIPDELKILAYFGHLSQRMEQLELLQKRNRGGQSKEISDDLKRAEVFLGYRTLLISKGHKNPSNKTVLEFCVQAAKILHDLGEITDQELSLWTKASLKSMQNTIKKGVSKLEQSSRMNNRTN
jgi:hypothetical protein